MDDGRSAAGRLLVGEQVLLNRIFQGIARYPALHRLVKPVGGPMYRTLLANYARYMSWRAGLRFAPGVAPATGIEYATGSFEPETTALLRQLLRPGATCIDIGANIGYYTRLAAQIVGTQGRVIACEPEPENIRALRYNTRRFPQVSLVPIALAGTRGLLPLYLSSHSSCHSLVERDYFKDGSYLLVPTMSFDELCQAVQLEYIDLVKVDVEGAEPLVLQGMTESLARRRIGALIIEFSPHNIIGAQFEPQALAAQLLDAFNEIRVIDSPIQSLVGRQLADRESFEQVIALLDSQPRQSYVNLLCR